MKTLTLPIKKSADGKPIDPEYGKKWERFAQLFNEGFGKKKRKVPVGESLWLRGRVYEVIGPFWHDFEFKGTHTWKRAFEIHAELREEGMEGLRFFMTVPASFDNRAHWYKLYYATTGQTPDEDDDSFDYNPALVTVRDVKLKIKRGKNNGTNKRGGFYANLSGFDVFESDEDDDEIREDAWKEVPNEGREKMEAAQNAAAEAEAEDDTEDEDEDSQEKF